MSTASRGINIGPPRFKIAIHAIVWLAKSGGTLSSATIASQVDSHATFMRRVMQMLTMNGFVESKGGREGGYTLRRPADQITLGEVYAAVSSCPSEQGAGGPCGQAGEQLDAELEKILIETERQTIDYLRKYTVKDVMNRVEFFEY
ncbi:MAG: Rrf2 family transcriptional regulator [Paenibacillaceae bacterium]|nr:Rrf2 family transcriptional regulator [Paenibacillaceae bacterium]